MLVVKVELHSARTGKVTEVGCMHIANDGSSRDPTRGSYDAVVHRRGRTKYRQSGTGRRWISQYVPLRVGRVENFPRLSYSVWRLVIRALRSAFPEEK